MNNDKITSDLANNEIDSDLFSEDDFINSEMHFFDMVDGEKIVGDIHITIHKTKKIIKRKRSNISRFIIC